MDDTEDIDALVASAFASMRAAVDWSTIRHKAVYRVTDPSPSGKMQMRCIICERVTAGMERECHTFMMER